MTVSAGQYYRLPRCMHMLRWCWYAFGEASPEGGAFCAASCGWTGAGRVLRCFSVARCAAVVAGCAVSRASAWGGVLEQRLGVRDNCGGPAQAATEVAGWHQHGGGSRCGRLPRGEGRQRRLGEHADEPGVVWDVLGLWRGVGRVERRRLRHGFAPATRSSIPSDSASCVVARLCSCASVFACGVRRRVSSRQRSPQARERVGCASGLDRRHRRRGRCAPSLCAHLVW